MFQLFEIPGTSHVRSPPLSSFALPATALVYCIHKVLAGNNTTHSVSPV